MNIPNNVSLALGALVAAVVVILLAGGTAARRKVADLRARGLYPPAGQATDADVRRLLQGGEKIMAIRCYREIHQVGLKEAKDAVELLEANGS